MSQKPIRLTPVLIFVLLFVWSCVNRSIASPPVLNRIATMPDGAEVTGLSFNSYGDLFLNAQHPDNKSTYINGVQPALVGFIPKFSSITADPVSMAIPEINERDSVQVVHNNYVTLAKAGDILGNGQLFGGVYDTSGELMYVSNSPDFNGFIANGTDSAFLYTGWEGAGRNGIGAISKIPIVRQDGSWKADLNASKMLDLSSVHGGFVICSGVVTPWGSPLLAEEYFFYGTSVWNHPANHDADDEAAFQNSNDISYIKPINVNQYLGSMSNPYRYGYMIEILNANSHSDESLVKHYATGRLSHESAAIMPDSKTVYMTDDDSAAYKHKKYNTASGGVLFKFVADHPRDLSSGILYAAKLNQDNNQNPQTTGFDVSWIMLGQGNNAQVEQWIADYDHVKVEDYIEGQSNYISSKDVQAWAEGKLQSDLNNDGVISQFPDDRPAFLESRRAAAALGATNEWDKLEGITSNGTTVYLATSSISSTMDESWGHLDWASGKRDKNNSGAISLHKEDCGAIYIARTGNDYNIHRLEPYVVGQTMPDGSCNINKPAQPDNILALPDGALIIGEDGGKKKHPLNMLWLAK